MSAAEPEAFDVEALRAAVAAGRTPEYLFFWGHAAKRPGVLGRECLSQWYPAPFAVDDVHFATAEHFMMWRKARLFGDEEAAARVLAARDPGKAKAVGRTVKGFDDVVWAAERFAIVAAGSRAKFGQHAALGAFLAATGRRVLVEASPMDRVWGIGRAESHADAQQPATWNGLNLLGFALMHARAALAAQR